MGWRAQSIVISCALSAACATFGLDGEARAQEAPEAGTQDDRARVARAREAWLRNAAELAKLTDAELVHRYAASAEKRASSRIGADEEEAYEGCLVEMVRRGNATMVEALCPGGVAPKPRSAFSSSRRLVMHGNLEALTALRRLQGEPDPLTIEVRLPDVVTVEFPELPSVFVTLRNVDRQGVGVDFTRGGNYRGGRQARWRFDVHDDARKAVPIQQADDKGGLVDRVVLESGMTWETGLDMRSYISLPRPGNYTVTVQYHDSLYLSNIDETAGLITTVSRELRLVVRPRRIALSKRDRTEADRLIAELPVTGRLLVLGGTYGPYAHAFIKPSSAGGQLLTMGWRAVPSLLEALRSDTSTPHQRSWILGLLFSITGMHDPRGFFFSSGRAPGGVLPPYDTVDGPWAVGGAQDGSPQFEAWGIGGTGSSEQALDVSKQSEFIERWAGFGANLDVVASEEEEKND